MAQQSQYCMSEKNTHGSDSSTELGAGKIIIKGARTHNLKNISVEMPRNKMIVFTGLSGSGKSSLAFDTIFAEGQQDPTRSDRLRQCTQYCVGVEGEAG